MLNKVQKVGTVLMDLYLSPSILLTVFYFKKYSFIESKITNRQKRGKIVKSFRKYQRIITEGLSFSTFSVTIYFSLLADQPYVATSMIICTYNL